MSGKYILALDQGTTSSRAVLYGRDARAAAKVNTEFAQHFPEPGWVEHDPEDIYSSVITSMARCLAESGVTGDMIDCVAITNQRETTVAWDAETGKPVTNAIVWQCRRTAPMIDAMDTAARADIRSRTGLVPDAYFSATKMRWILENVAEARRLAELGRLRFGTVDTWLVWRLTDGRVYATDHSNASRTMLYNIDKLCWDSELLERFGIPSSALPEVRPSSGYFGETYIGGTAVPIMAIAGDQQAALFGQCCFDEGEIKATFGTGAFLLQNTGSRRVDTDNGLLSTIAWVEGGRPVYALEGSVFNAGTAIKWLRDELCIIKEASECDALAESVADNGGVYFVPAFTGLGAPYWDAYARGALLGLTRGAGRASIARAVIESIAYQTRDVFECFRGASGLAPARVTVDGGVARSDVMLRFLAGIIGVPVERPADTESTSLGAAAQAGIATGFWSGRDELRELRRVERVFKPELDAADAARYVAGWEKAVGRALGYAER